MLHKIKALLALFLFSAMGMQAQFSVTGKIIDKESGEYLPGAHIKLAGQLAVSNSQGYYKLEKIGSGVYQIEVSYLGYSIFNQEVKVDKNLTYNVEMTVSPKMEDAVVIVAHRANDKMGTSFTNLTKMDIKKADAGMDIPYLIEMTPGLVTNSDAGTGIGYTSMRIRGSDPTRINITINGIPFNDPESQGAYFVNLPDLAGSLNNVQIQRGVGTSVNGAAAFGATIDMQTQGLQADPSAELSLAYGSFNTQRYRLAASTGLIADKYTFDMRLSNIHSDGYIDRASADLKSFFVTGARYGKNSILRINVFSGQERTYQAWSGVPKDSLKTNRTYNPYTYQNEVDNYTQTHYHLLYSLKAGKKWILNSALFYTKGYGYYENFKEDESLSGYGLPDYIIGNDTISSMNTIQQKWLDNDFYGAIFNANYNSKNLKLTLGGGINQYRGDHFGEIIWAEYALMGKDYRWYENEGLKTDMNIYAKATWFISNKLNLFGDLQYRRVDYSMSGIHDDLHDLTSEYHFNFVNPKVGIVYDLNDKNQIFSSFAIANKEPSRGNYRDADAGYIPQSEQLQDLEMGYSHNRKNSLFRANLYVMNYKNQLVETGKVNNVGMPIMINVDNSFRAGIELVAGWRPADYFNWNFNVAVSQNKILNFTEYVDNWDSWTQESADLGTTDIAFSPNLVLKNSFDVKVHPTVEIALQTRYVSRQYIDNTSNLSRSIDPYLVSDLIINFTPVLKQMKNLSVYFRVNNLFNEEYETSAWVYRYRTGGQEYVMDGYFPQAGIHFNSGVSMKF